MLPCCKSLLRFGFQKAVYMKAAKQTEKVVILKHVAREVYKISDALRGVGEMSEVKISDNLTNVQISPSNTCYYPLVRVLFHCQCLQFQREMRANLISNQQCIPYEWDHKTRIRSTCLTNTDPDPEPSAKCTILALYLHYTTHHFIHLPLFPTLLCILFLPFKQCLHLLTLLPPTHTTFTHNTFFHFNWPPSFKINPSLSPSPHNWLHFSPSLKSSPSPSSSRSFSQSSGEQACRRAWRWRVCQASVVFGAPLGVPLVPSASLPASLPPSACSQHWCYPHCTCGTSSLPAG